MKFVFLAGGAAGFLIASTTDYLSGRTADRTFFDGCVGCLAGALLMRWFWGVLLRGVRDTYAARHLAALAAAAATQAAQQAAQSAPVHAAVAKPRL